MRTPNLDNFVLCWLATASKEGQPNVSPKEVFFKSASELLIANIASPVSLKNIQENPKVCVCGVNIWTQKGFQWKGEATILRPQDNEFKKSEALFRPKIQGKFRIQHILKIDITATKAVVAPSYIFYPNTKEEDQVSGDQKVYLKNSR